MTSARRSSAVVVLFLALSAPLPAAAQCEDISWEMQAGLLHIRHDAHYNCAVHTFQHDVRLLDDVLVVDEFAMASGFADCICDYRTEIVVAGVESTVTTLRFGFGECLVGEPPANWTSCTVPLTLPATDAGGSTPAVTLVDSRMWGCGVVAGVPAEESVPCTSWGRVKAAYR